MMKERGLCKCLLLEISSKERWVIQSLHLWVFFSSVPKHHVASHPNTRLKVSLKQQTLLTPQAALFLLAVFKSLSRFNLLTSFIVSELMSTGWAFLNLLSSFAQFSPCHKYAIDPCKIKKVKHHLPFHYILYMEAVTCCLSKYPFNPPSLTGCCSPLLWLQSISPSSLVTFISDCCINWVGFFFQVL